MLINFICLAHKNTKKKPKAQYVANILSDCHKSDEIYYLLNAFRLDKKPV